MPRRVISLLLAAVLLWSGLATLEAPNAPAVAHAALQAGSGAWAGEGSVTHHHLDDLPAQAQHDPATDPPDLAPATPAPRLRPRADAPSLTPPTARALPPLIAAPLRPPRTAIARG